jgi:hypothetical protein
VCDGGFNGSRLLILILNSSSRQRRRKSIFPECLAPEILDVNRLNVFWGLDWQAVPRNLGKAVRIDEGDIVIGCVDTRDARALIRIGTGDCSSVDYWLDVGNNANSGQFVLGEPLNETNRRSRMRLRTVAELYPEIADAELDND